MTKRLAGRRALIVGLIAVMAVLLLAPTWYWAVFGMSSKVGWAWTWTTILGEPFLGWCLFMVVTE